MSKTMTMNVAMLEVERGRFTIIDGGKKVNLIVTPLDVEYIARKCNEWLRDRRAELERVEEALCTTHGEKD